MRQLLSDLSDIEGRTIESTAECDWEEMLALHFNDGTSIIIKVEERYHICDLEIESESPSTCNCDAYASLGIISTKEAETIKEKAAAKEKQRRKDVRRSQYEKLKIEFGD